MSELVILCLLVRVAQDGISLGCLLELFLSLLVTWVLVRVVFDGQFPIGLLYFICRGVSPNAKHLIIISFFCHSFSSSSLWDNHFDIN